MSINTILKCQNLAKSYKDGTKEIPVLQNLQLDIAPKERVAIVGKSGSGKTTLINLLGGLDKPTAGQVYFESTDIHTISDRKRGLLRNQLFGYVFQFHHLLAEFNALENVAMPLLIRGEDIAKVKQASAFALEQVGLSHRLTHKPNQLSGGERQRVAIARALVTKPKCVLADEPTGNLDVQSADAVYNLMMDLSNDVSTSFIIVTHDEDLAFRMDRVLKLEDGKLIDITASGKQNQQTA